MRVVKVNKSPTKILYWLKNETFNELVDTLWDKYLWIYNLLLKLLSSAISDVDLNKYFMYLVYNDDKITGFGIVHEKTLYFDGKCSLDLKAMLEYCRNHQIEITMINTRNDELVIIINKQNDQFILFDSVHKYYINKEVPIINTIKVRELTNKDQTLFNDALRRIKKEPYDIIEAMNEGFRYFGAIEENRLVSIACLTQLTIFRAELIAVVTFEENDRKKGFSKAVCSYAINEGLKENKVITWTANVDNMASIKTAKSLGMNHYDSRFIFKKE